MPHAASGEVAIYVHDLRSSGVVRMALDIAARVARDRPTTLVAGFGDGLFAKSSADGDARVAVLKEGPPDRAGRAGAAWRLRGWLRREPPAMLFSAGNYGHPTVWLAARGLATSRVYGISNEVARGGRVKTAIHAARMRRFIADATRVAIVGEAIAASPMFAPAMADGRGVLIRNGVDADAAKRLASAPAPHAWLDEAIPVVVAVGRLHAQKNLDLLLDAFAILRRKTSARLIVVGTGPASERKRLAGRAATLGIAADTLFAGETDNVFAWLARASVFALPSRWEGSSLALLEALAVGTPIVATRSAGDAAWVLDGGNYGLLADPDPASFAEALAIQMSPSRILPGARAEAYALSVTLDGYAALFNDVAAAQGPHR